MTATIELPTLTPIAYRLLMQRKNEINQQMEWILKLNTEFQQSATMNNEFQAIKQELLEVERELNCLTMI